ncbi:acyltransferase [Kordiimonas sp. SCSIO 12610]|uniref:acyltransferase family protein n=1 Tax=Kordiimonas sp. SCSIO 12610 TaxID=2829597 RepID=UPI00210AAC85|nr:acyltransferase [Kordiimonas sp. SCSIO 12610]UTW55865.1 acyltransferase [Kordiimonas sp. SCSIO 12610]
MLSITSFKANISAGIRLADVSDTRDNNYNLLRFLAAAGVIVSHSYPLSHGAGTHEPLSDILGFSLGRLSVYIFFVVSGFLIAKSFCQCKGMLDYTLARVFRIFPALIAIVLLSALVLGPIVSELPANTYFSDISVYTYIIRNISLVSLQFGITGVFEDNIYPSAINGSLWTLPYEIACYIMIACIGFVGAFRSKSILFLVLFAYGLAWLFHEFISFDHALWYKLGLFLELSLYFWAGSLSYIYRDRIALNLPLVIVFLLLSLVFIDTDFFKFAFAPGLTLAIFYLVYIPAGLVREYNKLGDYSYGLYIIAFPTQQVLSMMIQDISPLEMMLYTFFITLFFSVISWHILEKPALRLRRYFIK